jgi:hypothetical protein
LLLPNEDDAVSPIRSPRNEMFERVNEFPLDEKFVFAVTPAKMAVLSANQFVDWVTPVCNGMAGSNWATWMVVGIPFAVEMKNRVIELASSRLPIPLVT